MTRRLRERIGAGDGRTGFLRRGARRALECAVAASLLTGAGCAAARAGGGDRVEEQVAARRPAEAGGRRETAVPVDARSPAVGETRALHGTVNPRTGQRTAEAAVDLRLREPRRLDVEAGRVRRAADAYHPEADGLAWGYRVQVAAETDYAEAVSVAGRLKEPLGGRFPVYVEFVEPWYKVRVGDFHEEDAARALLAELRGAGWPDAWTVRTTIADAGAEAR